VRVTPGDEVDLLAERDRERVLGVGGLVGVLTHLDVGELQVAAGDEGGGLGGGGRLGAGAARRGVGQVRGGGEPPRGADQGPDAEAEVLVGGDGLELAVAGGDAFAAAADDAGVGVGGAGRERGLDGAPARS
jgi:hypothetical protein